MYNIDALTRLIQQAFEVGDGIHQCRYILNQIVENKDKEIDCLRAELTITLKWYDDFYKSLSHLPHANIVKIRHLVSTKRGEATHEEGSSLYKKCSDCGMLTPVGELKLFYGMCSECDYQIHKY